MATLVRVVFEELEPDFVGELVIGELPPVDADPALLRQVLANLLTNALKYTSKREGRRIEVGHAQGSYFVRDNGVGFDMRYAGRLFGVFERLHPASEFEGTGVGLALVKRIVERHGGGVRAEGAVGEGATIYFSLGDGGGAG
jgi:light-regulated signal transduction histidine kinase (bacteriophytochrome)